MAELKTKRTTLSVTGFLKAIQDEKRRKDAQELLRIFTLATKERSAIWGTSIVGFGSYHYKSERSTQEGDWPLTGFSLRKQNLTVYIMAGTKKYPALLSKLGKHTISGGSCIYIKRLSDVDTKILEKIIIASVKDMKKRYATK
jgi:hypothetical protein